MSGASVDAHLASIEGGIGQPSIFAFGTIITLYYYALNALGNASNSVRSMPFRIREFGCSVWDCRAIFFAYLDAMHTIYSYFYIAGAGSKRADVLRSFEAIRKEHEALFEAHYEIDSAYVIT